MDHCLFLGIDIEITNCQNQLMPAVFDRWTCYWAMGNLTSLPEDFHLTYGGVIAEFWESIFLAVPNKGRMLDICTGNGAIALMAARYFNKAKEVEIFAADSATIFPERAVRNNKLLAKYVNAIKFMSESPIETLQLPLNSFDLITSQYGYEYTHWETSAKSIARLLKHGGTFAMICHSQDSGLFEAVRREAEAYRRLGKYEITNYIRQFVDGLDGDVPLFRKRIEKIQSGLTKERKSFDAPLYYFVLSSLSDLLKWDNKRLKERRSQICSFADVLDAGQDRALEVLEVNQSLGADPKWYEALEDSGLKLTASGEMITSHQVSAGIFYQFRRLPEQ